MISSNGLASVLLGLDDPQVTRELVSALEAAGHEAACVSPLETTPARGRPTPDLLVIDGDAPGMDLAVVAAAWRRREPPPGMVVLGSTHTARTQAERVHARLVPKPVDPGELVGEIARMLLGGRPDTSLNPDAALRLLGLLGGGLPDDEAAMIIAGSRKVDVTLVREALRPHIFHYATSTYLLERLLQRRTLGSEEARLAISLDGGRTVRGAIDGLPRAPEDHTPVGTLSSYQSARLVWALAASGAAVLTPEPPAGHPTARLRAHLRARKAAFANATHYRVLELGIDATAADVISATALAELRYGPAAVAEHDLGDLAGVAARVWEQVARARLVLGDERLRAEYDAALVPRPAELEERRQRRRAEADDAERAFLRGQHALAAGDVSRAVSELAGAARRFPDHPDYEAYAAWVRFVSDDQRDPSHADRQRLAARERTRAEAALLGRRPWPRALCALGLLCEAAGDAPAAAAHLREALLGDDKLTPARQALARLKM